MFSLQYQVLHILCLMSSNSCLIVSFHCPISRVQCTFLFGPMDTCQSHLHYSASIYYWQFGDRHYSLPHFCSLLLAFRCHHKTQNTQKGSESREHLIQAVTICWHSPQDFNELIINCIQYSGESTTPRLLHSIHSRGQ